MAEAQGPILAAVLLLISGLHCSSPPPACPESCTCQTALLLNCSSSGLSSVPQHIQDSVTELDLSHNLLDSVTLHRPHHNLRNVWLGNNSITHLSLCIERNPGSQSVRGRYVHRLRPWSRHGCVSWAPTLQLLSVERNQLVQLPEGLEGSASLWVLQLSFNRISSLRPGDLSHLRQLKELHLQHNLITNLHPQMFQDLAQLRVLDLSFNMLTSLHPLMYLSLRNIGADVELRGNRWQCDCSMRSLRRRMAYDSSLGLQAWSMVCASPSILSGKDLLQLEEDDLNCFGTENRPELHRDVTVYSGSEILLSCSAQDSTWWMPSGQASVSQPQAELLISDVTERNTGLYVCMSEEDEVVSVFNLQISRIGGASRKTRSLPRTSQQAIPQDTPNRTGQERNQRATQSTLALAVCLSVFITFLIAFILGVLARPCIDVLWTKATNKESHSETNSVPSGEQRQYDNEAYSNGEEPEEIVPHRERRVTFSSIDFREESNVQYYDTVASGDQESINNDAEMKCEATKVEDDDHAAGDSGSENSLQQSTEDGRDLSGATDAGRTHQMEFEHIPDPVELEERRGSSSSSDSDRALKEDHITQGDHTRPKSPQLTEDNVQQRADFSSSREAEVPQISIEGSSEIPGFSSEPFADWSPHTNITPDLWQENGEQFEFSDSVRSTSARSSSMFGSFNDAKLIGIPTSDRQSEDDVSSSSSHVSEDEPTQYTVNSEQEEEYDIERNHNKSEISSTCLEQDARPSFGFDQGDNRHDPQRPAEKPEHSSSSHSSDSDGESMQYTVKQLTDERDTKERVKPMPHTKWHGLSLGVTAFGKSLDTRAPSPPTAYSSSSSIESEAEITAKPKHNKGRVSQIKKRLDINAQASDLSSSDETTDETKKHKKKQEQGEVDMARLQFQTVSHDSNTRWPAVDLKHAKHIQNRLNIKAPSLDSDLSSSSDSQDEAVNRIWKHEQGEVHISKSSQAKSNDPETQRSALHLEHTKHIQNRLDSKAPSPDSSSGSDSDDETTYQTERPGKLPLQTSQTLSYDPHAKWPVLDIGNIPSIKRHLDVKAPSLSPESSSSSDSENETTHHTERPVKVGIAELPLQKSQTERHNLDATWPAVDLEHIPNIKRRLDIKAPSLPLDSSSSSDSEDETTNHIKKQERGEIHKERFPIKASQTVSHDPDAKWPALHLEHTTHIKRRLDIKAPSPDSTSVSSSDSEDETAGCTVKKRPAKVDIAILQKSQTLGHDEKARWPAVDLEHVPSIKRRLDIKAPPESSSSSDSEDERTNCIKKQGEIHMATVPVKASQTVSHDPKTQWPALDLEQTRRIKRRLDIKAPSLDSDSSSSSGSEGETKDCIVKQWPAQVDIASNSKISNSKS
ncbi:uncharacterized protein LOC108878836 [Lates calcarifer]|nr:uncharacterized protein LOC108878836 [Lates calcarifer]